MTAPQISTQTVLDRAHPIARIGNALFVVGVALLAWAGTQYLGWTTDAGLWIGAHAMTSGLMAVVSGVVGPSVISLLVDPHDAFADEVVQPSAATSAPVRVGAPASTPVTRPAAAPVARPTVPVSTAPASAGLAELARMREASASARRSQDDERRAREAATFPLVQPTASATPAPAEIVLTFDTFGGMASALKNIVFELTHDMPVTDIPVASAPVRDQYHRRVDGDRFDVRTLMAAGIMERVPV